MLIQWHGIPLHNHENVETSANDIVSLQADCKIKFKA